MPISFPRDVRAWRTLRTIRIVKPTIHPCCIAHHDDAAIPRLNEILGLIGMVHDPTVRPSAFKGHQQRVGDEIGVDGRTHRPADDLSRVGVQDRGEVQPALAGAQVGDVGRPQPVGPDGLKSRSTRSERSQLLVCLFSNAGVRGLRPAQVPASVVPLVSPAVPARLGQFRLDPRRPIGAP